MPVTCIVIDCGSRGGRDSVSFFSVPTARNFPHKPLINELSQRRRDEWLSAVKRSDLTEKKIKNGRVCSRHFISGKPASLEDVNHPDWVPTQNMGYSKIKHSELTTVKQEIIDTEQEEPDENEEIELHSSVN